MVQKLFSSQLVVTLNSSGKEVKGQGEGTLLSLGVKSDVSEGIVICVPVGAGGNLEK